MEHECIIGQLHGYEYSPLITIRGLTNHINDNIEFNDLLKNYPSYDTGKLRRKIYTFADYGDKRKSTDISRFNYCPECGRAIDWKIIKGCNDELRKDQ